MNQAIETGIALRDRMAVINYAERLVEQGKLSQADLEAEIAQWEEESLASLIHSTNRFAERLIAQGKLSQADLEAEIARIKELQGDAPNGSQTATYTEANEREFTELCEQYSKAAADVRAADAALNLAYYNAREAEGDLGERVQDLSWVDQRLRAYALLFGFALPDELREPVAYKDGIPF